MRYEVFISYSHATDGKLAPAIQTALYKFAKPWYKRRAMSIFRDKTSLSLTPALWPSIQKAISESKYFLLLASPEAAKSPWVEKELEHWILHKSITDMFIVLTSGEIFWNHIDKDYDWERTTALPKILKGAFQYEPLFLDMRWAINEEHLSIRQHQFREGITILAAALRGISPDDIVGEDVRQHRKTKRIVWSAVLTLFFLTVLSIAGIIVALKQKTIADIRYKIALSQRLADQAEISLSESNLNLSLLLATESLSRISQKGRSQPLSSSAETIFRKIVSSVGGKCLSGHEGKVVKVAFNSDGNILATASEDGTVMLHKFNRTEGYPVVLRSHTGPVRMLTFGPKGRYMATCSDDHTARLWDLKDLKSGSLLLSGHTGPIKKVVFSYNGRYLATCSDDSTARLWDLEHPISKPVILRGHKGQVKSAAFSPDDKKLATCGEEGTVRIWELSQHHNTVVVFRDHLSSVEDVAFNSDGKKLATCSSDQRAYIWNLDRPNHGPIVFSGHTSIVKSVLFSPDDRFLVTASIDHTARLWNVSDPSKSHVLRGHQGGIEAMAFSPNGKILITGSSDNTARLWAINQPNEEPIIMHGHDRPIETVAFSPDGRFLATGSSDNTSRLWDLYNLSSEPKTIPLPKRGEHSNKHEMVWVEKFGFKKISFSPNYRYLAAMNERYLSSGKITHELRLWDFKHQTKKPFTLASFDTNRVLALTFSPDGRYLSAGFGGHNVKKIKPLFGDIRSSNEIDHGKTIVWELESITKKPKVVLNNELAASTVTFSPDGRYFASGSLDGFIKVWNTKELAGDPLAFLKHDNNVESVAFNQDGRYLATGCADGIARIWKTEELYGDPFAILRHENTVQSIVFRPDKQHLATRTDLSIHLWNLNRLESNPQVFSIEMNAFKLAFSSTGRYFGIGGITNLRIIDIKRIGSKPILLRGHRDPVTAIAFSPDEKSVVTGSYLAMSDNYSDVKAYLWNLENPQINPAFLFGHMQGVLALEYSQEEDLLISVDGVGTIRKWLTNYEKLINIACNKASRNFTCREWRRYFGNQPYLRTCVNLPVNCIQGDGDIYSETPSEISEYESETHNMQMDAVRKIR